MKSHHIGSVGSQSIETPRLALIVRRDVKPENIVVAEPGGEPDLVKMLDFGIVRMTQSAEGELNALRLVTIRMPPGVCSRQKTSSKRT